MYKKEHKLFQNIPSNFRVFSTMKIKVKEQAILSFHFSSKVRKFRNILPSDIPSIHKHNQFALQILYNNATLHNNIFNLGFSLVCYNIRGIIQYVNLCVVILNIKDDSVESSSVVSSLNTNTVEKSLALSLILWLFSLHFIDNLKKSSEPYKQRCFGLLHSCKILVSICFYTNNREVYISFH